jgi:hypothetical protein
VRQVESTQSEEDIFIHSGEDESQSFLQLRRTVPVRQIKYKFRNIYSKKVESLEEHKRRCLGFSEEMGGYGKTQ